MGQPLGIGIVGCGNISGAYLNTLPRLGAVRLVAVADINPALAEAAAAVYPGARALSVADLVADPQVDLVLNLTIPAVHAEIAGLAIAAGKHVYGEKPLAASAAEAKEILDAAATAGVTVGCAPDTVLGTGIQTARHALDSGLIGRPLSATATMVTPGHELWHPNPDFYYVPGGGPLLDMGPYYVTALLTLLGPVTSVIGAATHTRDIRTIGSGPREGEQIPVTTDTHVTGVLTHASGALSTMVMSFDAVATHSANIEIHGETGSLKVPDPNMFDGAVELFELGADAWRTITPTAGYVAAGRGIGIQDLALTPSGTLPRASGELAYHALEVMESLLASAHSGQAVAITSTCQRPDTVPLTEPEQYGVISPVSA